MKIKMDILGDISLAYADFEQTQRLLVARKINGALGHVNYRIANLESPFCFGNDVVPIKKDGPNLRMEEKSLPFFEQIDIDAYTLANNHLGDYGEKGIIDSLATLKALNKEYVGSSGDYGKIYSPLRKTIKGIKLSILSVCENEFGTAHEGILGSAGYDKERIQSILKEEHDGCDFSIIIFHGGTENYPYPTPEQQRRYRELIDAGATVVVGMHPHCPQGIEEYAGGIIVYSTGNFFFPLKQKTPFETWCVGYVVRLELERGQIPKLEVIPYEFDILGRDFNLLNRKQFMPYLKKISENIAESNFLNGYLCNFYKAWAVISGKKRFDILKECIEGQNRDSEYLIKNLFCCESHNELMKTYFSIKAQGEEHLYFPFIDEIKRYINVFEFMNGEVEDKKNDKQESTVDAVIWGVGRKAEDVFNNLRTKRKQIVFVDKDYLKQGLYFEGIEILNPESAVGKYKDAVYYVCTSTIHQEEIRQYLLGKNIHQTKIILK